MESHNKKWCYLEGGMVAAACPGAEKSKSSNQFWTTDGVTCENADRCPRENGLSGAQLQNNNDAYAKCSGRCKAIGKGWEHNGHWWPDGKNKGKSICHCVKACPPQPTLSPTIATDDPTPTPSAAPCTPEENGLSGEQLKNTNAANKKCPGRCKALGDGWMHNGHWWHDNEIKGNSICHCVKGCSDDPCPVGFLALEETKKCSIDDYTCIALDGPECCNGRLEDTRKCIPCDETMLRRGIHETYSTAGSCDVYRCPRGSFDTVHACDVFGEFCDHEEAVDNCLTCWKCFDQGAYWAVVDGVTYPKCPECPDYATVYAPSKGACRGGHAPDKDAGRTLHGRRDCKAMCDANDDCTGYVLGPNGANWCETYFSKGIEGDRRKAFTCYSEAPHCWDIRTKRHCNNADDGCVWVGDQHEGKCIYQDAVPANHCTLVTDQKSCERFPACAWKGGPRGAAAAAAAEASSRGGCLNFTPEHCKYYKKWKNACQRREECEWDPDARRGKGTCRAAGGM